MTVKRGDGEEFGRPMTDSPALKAEFGEDMPQMDAMIGGIDWPDSTSPFWRQRSPEHRRAVIDKIKAAYKSRGELEREWEALTMRSGFFRVLSWTLNLSMRYQQWVLNFMSRRWNKPEFKPVVNVPEAQQTPRERPVDPLIEIVWNATMAQREKAVKDAQEWMIRHNITFKKLDDNE